MHHPVILAVPLLMLLDYALTILGARASLQVYRRHFRMPHYELNPLWQKSVAQRRWFNPRHLGLVCLVTALLLLPEWLPDFPFAALQLPLGMLLGAYVAVCGRHLTNLLLFWYLNRHPEEISGEVTMTQRLGLRISLFNVFGLVPLAGLVAALAPEPYPIGVLLGVLAIALAHIVWVRRAGPKPPSRSQQEEG